MKAILLKTAVAAAFAVTAVASGATPLTPVFTVDPGVGERGSLGANFTANNISADYNETITFTSATDFKVSIQFGANSFSLKDTGGNVNYNAGQTGLGVNYGLYGLFTASGTYDLANSKFILTPSTGTFSLYMDKDLDTNTFTQPATGASPYVPVDATPADDILLATGLALNGNGFNAAGPNLSGAFGQTTSVDLTAAGSAFFTSPVPFYMFSFQSGQFEGFPVNVGATVRNTGTMNIVFQVPEPSAIALSGLALLAAGLASRRKRSA